MSMYMFICTSTELELLCLEMQADKAALLKAKQQPFQKFFLTGHMAKLVKIDVMAELLN